MKDFNEAFRESYDKAHRDSQRWGFRIAYGLNDALFVSSWIILGLILLGVATQTQGLICFTAYLIYTSIGIASRLTMWIRDRKKAG